MGHYPGLLGWALNATTRVFLRERQTMKTAMSGWQQREVWRCACGFEDGQPWQQMLDMRRTQGLPCSPWRRRHLHMDNRMVSSGEHQNHLGAFTNKISLGSPWAIGLDESFHVDFWVFIHLMLCCWKWRHSKCLPIINICYCVCIHQFSWKKI